MCKFYIYIYVGFIYTCKFYSLVFQNIFCTLARYVNKDYVIIKIFLLIIFEHMF